MANIDRIINGTENAKEAANYGEAIVLDEELIDGTDYRLIITSAYTGDYPIIEN